jgi:hypothetical protein
LNPFISATQRVQIHFPIQSSISAQTVVAAHLSFSLFLQQAFLAHWPFGPVGPTLPSSTFSQHNEQKSETNCATTALAAGHAPGVLHRKEPNCLKVFSPSPHSIEDFLFIFPPKTEGFKAFAAHYAFDAVPLAIRSSGHPWAI